MQRVSPDRGVLLLQLLELLLEVLPVLGGLLDQVVLLVDLDVGDAAGAGQGVAAVGQAAGELALLEEVPDLLGPDGGPQLHVAGGDALGRGQDVGLDVEVLDAEPLAGPAPAGHDLVDDQQDAVLVAELAQALHVALRRDDDAVGPHDRLHDDGGHALGVVVHELFLEHGQGLLPALLLVLGAERVAVGVGAEEVHHAGDARLGGPAARVAGQGDGPRGGPVVALPGSVDLLPTGEPAGGLDGVLVGLRPAVGEEHVVQVAGGELGHHGGQAGLGLGAEARGDEAELLHLGLHGLQHVAVGVADVDVQQSRTAVDDLAAVRVVHVDPFGAVDHQWVPPALGLPAVDDVRAVQFLQLCGLHATSCGSASLLCRSDRKGQAGVTTR